MSTVLLMADSPGVLFLKLFIVSRISPLDFNVSFFFFSPFSLSVSE